MNKTFVARAMCVCALGLLVAGCGGGGDSPTLITISVQQVSPGISNDLNGGDPVQVTGLNFASVQILRVSFGGSPGLNMSVQAGVVSVTTPPAPNGQPGAVTVEVTYISDSQQRTNGLVGGYVYVDPALPPNPTAITRTSFTPSGAEQFFITGTSLGPPNGTQTVRFAGIGNVTCFVNNDGTSMRGNAPVATGVPPVGNINVFVEPPGQTPVQMTTPVTYGWLAPAPMLLPNQTAGNASQPVRLSDANAVLCTAGANGTWGDADDDIFIVSGPPGFGMRPIRVGGTTPVGYLSPLNSIPAVMDTNTFVVYSIGVDGIAPSNDDLVLHIGSAQSAQPAVTPLSFGGFLNTAPISAISATRIATTTAGPDGTIGTPDDQILIITFTGVTTTPAFVNNAGQMDGTGGANAWSRPFSPDGEHVYVIMVGPDATGGTGDDALLRVRASTAPAGFAAVAAPFLLGPPTPLGGGILAAPAGFAVAPGGVNDQLAVFNDVAGGTTITRTSHALNTRVNVGGLRPFARVGSGAFAVSVAGPDTIVNSGDEQVRVFTDPLLGTTTSLPMVGIHVLAGLGNGGMAIFGQGPDFTPATGDDEPRHLDDLVTTATPFNAMPAWTHGVAPVFAQDRVFLIGAGSDGTPGTGDEILIVHQTVSINAIVSTCQLPLALGAATRVRGSEAYVPIGPSWGIVQSPGVNGTYNDADDQLLVVSH